jgi:7-cyano-7-deazaguanine synthase
MEKVTVLFSGGLDSSVLLYDYKDTCNAIFIDYGQRNAAAEAKAVTEICSSLAIPFRLLSYPDLFKYTKSSILQHTEDISVKTAEIKFRNSVLITVAASTIEYQTTLLVGAHKTNAPYADCTPQYYKNIDKLIGEESEGRIRVVAPYIFLTKQQIVARARNLNMPDSLIAKSVSCYKGNACGECPACIARREALAGIYKL